jgi:hypothetical protein
MEGSHEWHGIAPNDEQLAKALAQLPETLGRLLKFLYCLKRYVLKMQPLFYA